MIYFDNSASGGFKPDAVVSATENAIKFLSCNPGRSGHKLALLGSEFIFKTRKLIANTFNNKNVDRVVFTKNCTEALNLAILGLANENDEIVTTVTEHNSVLRPLYHLMQTKGVTVKFAKPKNKRITPHDVMPLVTKNTKLVVVNAVSNVTGEQNEFEEIGKLLNCPYVVDGAQACGHVEIDMQKSNISALAIAGHKGLFSIQGCGVLAFRNVDVQPITFGGTGTESFEKLPSCYPELLESGTLNLPAICSLFEGCNYANENLAISKKRLEFYTDYIISELRKKQVEVFSRKNPFGIVAFALRTPSGIVADELSERFNIAVRGGFHCAPLLHKFLKTDENGLVRLSLCLHNTEKEIDYFLRSINTLIAEGY